MSLAVDLRAVCHEVRAIPGDLGLRPYTIAAVLRAWSGDEPGQGTVTTTSVPIVEARGQSPKMREVSDEDITSNLGLATIEVGPITPAFASGGTPIANLIRDAANGQTLMHFVVIGPEYPSGANFRLKAFDSSKSMHFSMTIERMADT